MKLDKNVTLLDLRYKFVSHFKIDKVNFETADMTLKINQVQIVGTVQKVM